MRIDGLHGAHVTFEKVKRMKAQMRVLSLEQDNSDNLGLGREIGEAPVNVENLKTAQLRHEELWPTRRGCSSMWAMQSATHPFQRSMLGLMDSRGGSQMSKAVRISIRGRDRFPVSVLTSNRDGRAGTLATD
jgi:hypothetical protein